MRMSSGASNRKLKPRCGSSSCGEDTPRSNNTPSTPPEHSAASVACNSPKRAWTGVSRGSRISRAAATASGSRSIAISRPRGPAAQESAGCDRPCRRSRPRTCRPRATRLRARRLPGGGGRGGAHQRSQREVFGAGRRVGAYLRERPRQLLVPRGDIPDLEMASLPDQNHVFLEAGELAQRARHEDAALRVELEFLGEPDEQPLPPARLFVEAGKRLRFRADRLPGDSGIKKQTAIGVSGENHRAPSG